MASAGPTGGSGPTKAPAKQTDPEDAPVVMSGLKGQLLRFGEHDIKMLRRELHAAVDEETRFVGEQKDVRKQLLDKVCHFFDKKTKTNI